MLNHLEKCNEDLLNEVIKLLDNGIIYSISDSKWVSPTQVVPKKSGVTVITNEKNELIQIGRAHV